MNKILLFIFTAFLLSCKSTTFFIVRHAEKETTNVMTNDVPLSAQGVARADALKSQLLNQHIQHIYSTNFIRTKSTARPLADALHLSIEIYDPRDSTFISRLRTNVHGNVLIVGHSNTVDDLVNGLTGTKTIADLPDSQYGDLFVVKKKGKNFLLTRRRFGE